MKKLYLLNLILIIFISCQNEQQVDQVSRDLEENQAFDTWVDEYKITTFQRCLFLGYNRSQEIRDLFKIDRSTVQDFPLGVDQYKYIDTLVQPIIEQAKLDSAENFNKYLNGMNKTEGTELNGIPIIKYCLGYFSSNELDSISKHRIQRLDFLWTSK